MKIFLLLCLSTGLVSTEKLDRTYLPPPGSKFSGGSPGDIQVPLEFPKEHYLTGPPLPEGIPEIELGINSRPKPVDTAESSTQKQERLTYFQNSYPVPKTTTTFAFTQTTTFAPTEDYEGLDQSSGFLNATDPSKHSHGAGQTYQQQSNRGYSGNDPSFTQYQQGNQPSTSVPFGSTTHRPLFKSNRKPVPYLPPAPEQVPSNQDNFGYLSGQPQGPALQDGQQYSSTFGPVISQPDSIPAQANQQKQFISNVNIPSSTAAPQNQGTNRIYAKQQKFTSSVPTQKNLDVSPGNQNILTSTIGPAYKDKTRVSTGPFEENQYVQHQDFPSSTTIQGEQRTPAWNHQNQYISSSVPPKYQDDQNESPGSGQHGYKQDQNNNPGNQNFPVSTAAPHFNGQQFTTPEILQEGNQRNPSTAFPQYQDNQRFKKPGRIQETIASNQQNFGSGIPNHQNQYSRNPNFPSTATPQLQNGQQFITPGSLQPNQYFRKQNFPSTAFPQYQDTQRIFRPSEQNQYYRPPTAASQSTDSNSIQSTTPGSIHKRPLVPQENQYQSERQQIHPSSTASLHQFPTPGSIQNQFVGDKNTVLPVTGSPLFQNGQRLSTPGVREQLSTQHGSITSNENEQYPSTLAPEYQTTFASTPGSIQGVTGINQYPTQPDYNQRFPSSTVASQQFVTGSQSQYGNNGIQSIPNTSPSSQSEIGSQVYDATSLAPYYLNQGSSSTTAGPLPTSGYPSPVSGPTQNRPERPQAASDRTADILSYENVLTPEGYSYSYDTSNGIHADETGIVGNGTRAQGAYSYIGDDGKVYSVFYSADENGFQPRGDHLPTPPPIPEAIQRVIEQANKDKESDIYDDGSYDEAKYGYMKYDFNQFRPKNKTAYPTNGADIPYRPENQFGSQKNKQFISKVETEVYQGEDSVEGMDYEPKQVDGEKLYNGKINLEGESNRRISNERPIKINNLTDEGKRKNDFNRRPDSVKDYEGTGITDISDDNVDFKDLDDVSKVLDYKDDPNSRTDFNGKNKYLPNPKHAHRFMQPDNRHLSTRLPENNKQVSKQRKPNNRKKVVYEDEQASNVNKEYVFDDDTKSMTSDRPNKPGNYQSENKRISKPNKSENVMDGVKNIHAMTGYEYTTPQRKFDFEGDIKFTSRISMTERPKQTTQIGSQTTLRPFMTPNVYKNDDESLDEVMVEFDPHKKQLRPFTQKDTHPVSGKESTEYNVTPEIAYDGQFDSTKSTTSRLPFGNPQTTSIPKYEEQDTIGQKEYNTPIRTQSSRRPDNNEDYSNIARNEGLSKEVSDAFVSTTPLPHLRSNFNKGNKPPAQDHTMRKPTDAPTFYEQYIPGKDANERRPITIEGSRFPGSQAQILSTTYRPKYTFGDRTLAPTGSIKEDGFGRPISSTIAPEDFVDISKNKPGNMEDTFSPGVGRFGVTSASTQGPGDYQGSTIAPVGEDFGGPKRPQGFDPETGYYYK